MQCWFIHVSIRTYNQGWGVQKFEGARGADLTYAPCIGHCVHIPCMYMYECNQDV